MRAARGVAFALLLASTAARADLCDGPCSLTIDFANGGSITTVGDGATITFGTGGVLELGAGGAITLGTGGSLTPNVTPPDMSAGGTLVLGAGGSVTFDTGGSLDTGSAGNVALAEGGAFQATGAASVAVDATQSVHVGDLTADGAIVVTAGGSITSDNTTAISFDATGSIDVTSDLDVTLATTVAPSITLNQASAGSTGPGFADCSSGCPAGTVSTIGQPTLPADSGTLGPYPQGAGAPGLLTLLPLLLIGLLRRR